MSAISNLNELPFESMQISPEKKRKQADPFASLFADKEFQSNPVTCIQKKRKVCELNSEEGAIGLCQRQLGILSEDELISINVSNNEVCEYPKRLLDKIPYFQERLLNGNDEIHLLNFSKKELELLLSCMHYGSLVEIFTEKELTDPCFYINLEAKLQFFSEKKPQDLRRGYISYEMESFPIAIIRKLIENWQKIDGETASFYIDVAMRILYNACLYKTDADYDKVCFAKRKAISEIHLIRNLKKIERMDLEKLSRIEKPHSQIQMAKALSEKRIQIYKKALEEKYLALGIAIEELDGNKEKPLQPWTAYRISKIKGNTGNLRLAEALAKAKTTWKLYKWDVLDALQFQSKKYGITDMQRKDLLVPQLFAYYNFSPKNLDKEKGTHFGHENHTEKFFYYLKNADLKALETEMREDLTKWTLNQQKALQKLPPFYQEKSSIEISIATEKTAELKKFFVPKFTALLNREEQMEVNKKLIECWNWSRFGIYPEDIHLRIYPAGMEDRNAVRMRGFLQKFDQRWTLTFSLDDFKPILYPAATPEATETLLHSKIRT